MTHVMQQTFVTSVIHQSAVGDLTLSSDGDVLVGVYFGHDPAIGEDAFAATPGRVLDRTRKELDRYFDGRLREFSVPIEARGTAFQRRVWSALQRIPYGETTSYGAIARQIRSAEAVRAVGAANGANPIPIIIPCHRVIGANGALTGFGGGLVIKRFLLDLERGITPLL
jgi:methylated-DNA-[protein]-cysteine S-methyltransferase